MTAMPVSTANEWMTELKTNKEHPYLVSVIWKVLYPAMKEANLVNDCLPDPPTPTKRAWPLGVLIMREILTKWIMASLKNTKSIPAPRILSLYCWRKYISLSSSWWKLSICEQKKKKVHFSWSSSHLFQLLWRHLTDLRNFQILLITSRWIKLWNNCY